MKSIHLNATYFNRICRNDGFNPPKNNKNVQKTIFKKIMTFLSKIKKDIFSVRQAQSFENIPKMVKCDFLALKFYFISLAIHKINSYFRKN